MCQVPDTMIDFTEFFLCYATFEQRFLREYIVYGERIKVPVPLIPLIFLPLIFAYSIDIFPNQSFPRSTLPRPNSDAYNPQK